MGQPSDRTSAPPATSSRRSFLKAAGALGLIAGMAGALGSPLVEAATRDAHAADDSNALVLWTFVDTHARWFKRRAAEYQKQVHHTFSLTVHQYPNPPYQQKLLTVLQTGLAT
jgi:ABC-type glycerol-3-phosphate transport system substrate-binding protein